MRVPLLAIYLKKEWSASRRAATRYYMFARGPRYIVWAGGLCSLNKIKLLQGSRTRCQGARLHAQGSDTQTNSRKPPGGKVMAAAQDEKRMFLTHKLVASGRVGRRQSEASREPSRGWARGKEERERERAPFIKVSAGL